MAKNLENNDAEMNCYSQNRLIEKVLLSAYNMFYLRNKKINFELQTSYLGACQEKINRGSYMSTHVLLN